MLTKALSIHDLVKANLDRLSNQEVARLMRWKLPLHVENMGRTYKKLVAPSAETTDALMAGYVIKSYLTKRIGEPK